MKTNKNSATEDQLGTLHSAVTKAFQRKIDLMMERVEEVDPEEAMFVIDEKTLNAAANWVNKNEITCKQPEIDAQSALSKSLADIKERQKGKVISFTDAKEAATS